MLYTRIESQNTESYPVDSSGLPVFFDEENGRHFSDKHKSKAHLNGLSIPLS
uniref:Uncharacterized protein n=1 Tax=Anguilla anguilla TaxID=7936 RepID=A0A0E9SBI0_ANGAN